MEIALAIGIVLQLATLAGLGLLWRRLARAETRVNRRIVSVADNLFRQVEALQALQLDLDLRRSLPQSRDWAASPDFLRSLVVHVNQEQPRELIECGSGLSTVVLARLLQQAGQGHVWSLEHEAQHAEATRRALRRHQLEHWATVVDAPLSPLALEGWEGQWYALTALPPELRFDLLVVDGPPHFVSPHARYPALPMLNAKLGSRAFVFLDDADRHEEQAIVARWLEEFPDLRLRDVPRCEKGIAVLARPWP